MDQQGQAPQPLQENPPPSYGAATGGTSAPEQTGSITFLIQRPRAATMRKQCTLITVLDAEAEKNLETVPEDQADDGYEEQSDDENGTQQTSSKLTAEVNHQRRPSADSFTEDQSGVDEKTAENLNKNFTWGPSEAYRAVNAPSARWGNTVRLISPTSSNVAELAYTHLKHNHRAVVTFQRFASADGNRADVEVTRPKVMTRAHTLTTPDGKTYTWRYEGKWKERKIVCRLGTDEAGTEVAKVSLNGSAWDTVIAHGDRKLTVNRDLTPEDVAIAGAMVMLRNERDRRRTYWFATSAHGGG